MKDTGPDVFFEGARHHEEHFQKEFRKNRGLHRNYHIAFTVQKGNSVHQHKSIELKSILDFVLEYVGFTAIHQVLCTTLNEFVRYA